MAILTLLALRCYGDGQVIFVPMPQSPTSRAAVVPVRFVGQPQRPRPTPAPNIPLLCAAGRLRPAGGLALLLSPGRTPDGGLSRIIQRANRCLQHCHERFMNSS